MTAREFTTHLQGVRPAGDGFTARCPGHDDKRASLSLQDGERGLLLRCHAGCSLEAITTALGLRITDLFTDDGATSARPSGSRIVATYAYCDEGGTVLYEVIRFAPKDFRQRRPNGQDRWTWNLNGVRRVLYRLPLLRGQAVVYIAEGEKDADRLADLGIPATTNAGGAGKWREEYAAQLLAAGAKRVVILPDNDSPGETHALTVAQACLAAGLVVKIVRLSGLPGKGDVSDWLDAGHAKDELAALVKATPLVSADNLQTASAEAERETDDTQSPAPSAPETSWPSLASEALQGLAGEIVRKIEPYTEADPVALLGNLLTGFGNVIGPGAHFTVEFTQHPARFFIGLVGASAKARKGQSWSTLRRLFKLVEEGWAKTRISSGLASGEGLIYHVRDARYEKQAIREKGRVLDYQEVLVDDGEVDKRLLLIEEELAAALKVMRREGNILSPTLRQAWDNGDLHPLTKTNPIRATGAHISIIGHITKDELLRHLDETEQGNGFANRFIFLLAKRSKCLPNPTPISEALLESLAERLKQAVTFTQSAGEVTRDPEAEALWAEIYHDLSEGRPGLTGVILARGEAQVMRLALTYALLDRSPLIRSGHLKAALALWDYAEASTRYIFGERLGDAIADRILEAARGRGAMTETEIYSSIFQRNVKAERIHHALALLHRLKRLTPRIEETGGRQKTVWEPTH